MTFIPVLPLVTKDGNLVSLEALRKNLGAKPINLDDGTTIDNSVVSLGGQQVSVSLAANLGVGSIFTAAVKANEFGFWVDALAFADSATVTTSDNIVNKTRWGYGLRMMFRARRLDASAKLSLPILGAQVQLGLASADYEVQTIGLGPKALIAILGGLSQFGTLDGNTFHDLNSKVLSNLSDLIANDGATFVARPLAVQVTKALELDSIVKAKSEIFAMRRIKDRLSLTVALQRAGVDYDQDAITAVYKDVAGDIPPDQQPSKQAGDFAAAFLK